MFIYQTAIKKPCSKAQFSKLVNQFSRRYRKKRKPILTAANQIKRLDYCVHMATHAWSAKATLFLDEKWFSQEKPTTVCHTSPRCDAFLLMI